MRASISIDVDSLRFYHQIHGLPERPVEDDPIYSVALPRFFELLAEVGVPATLFLVAEDAAKHPRAFEAVGPSGCEVASHSFRHDYALSQWGEAEIRADLEAADRALQPLNAGRPIVGFRAPGYNVSPALLEVVQGLGYRYDSSLLPAPAYFAARAAAIGLYGLRGRPSRSLVGRYAQFAGPLEPYRTTPATPWIPSVDSALLELPMAVEPTSRVPLIGTSLSALPSAVFDRLLSRALSRLSFFNFELHAIDLLDASDHASLGELAAHQRDLRVSAATKRRRLAALFGRLRDAAEVATLATHAEALSLL